MMRKSSPDEPFPKSWVAGPGKLLAVGHFGISFAQSPCRIALAVALYASGNGPLYTQRLTQFVGMNCLFQKQDMIRYGPSSMNSVHHEWEGPVLDLETHVRSQ